MKNIVFDFGGVVFQWRPAELLRRILPQRAPDDASADALVVAFFEHYRGDWGLFDRGTIEVDDLATRIVQRLGLSRREVLAVIEAVPGELQPQPGMVDLLRRLHGQGHAIYYLSNMPAPYASHLERSYAFFDRFTDGVFSSRVHLNKPEPEIYQLATSRFRIEPAQTVFIDDTAGNVDAARAGLGGGPLQ